MVYYCFLAIRRLVLLFPRKFSYFAADILSWLYFCAARGDRRAIAHNLSAFISDKGAIRRTTRRVFANFSYYLVDFFRYDKLDRSFIEQYVTVEGREYLDRALSAGKGAIALTAHIGNYELGGAVIALLGYHASAVALPHKDERTNRLFNAQRNKAGLKVVPTGVNVKRCFALLRQGEVIGFLGDRNFAGKACDTKMFGKTVSIPRGFSFFAMRTGAALVPTFFVRERRYRYRMIFEEALATEGKSEDEIIADYARVLERYLKKYPDQWYIFTRFWR